MALQVAPPPISEARPEFASEGSPLEQMAGVRGRPGVNPQELVKRAGSLLLQAAQADPRLSAAVAEILRLLTEAMQQAGPEAGPPMGPQGPAMPPAGPPGPETLPI